MAKPPRDQKDTQIPQKFPNDTDRLSFDAHRTVSSTRWRIGWAQIFRVAQAYRGGFPEDSAIGTWFIAPTGFGLWHDEVSESAFTLI